MKDEDLNTLIKALTYDGTDRPALIARIPVICNDIRSIDKRLGSIEGNISKGVWIVLAAFIGALLMLVLK